MGLSTSGSAISTPTAQRDFSRRVLLFSAASSLSVTVFAWQLPSLMVRADGSSRERASSIRRTIRSVCETGWFATYLTCSAVGWVKKYVSLNGNLKRQIPRLGYWHNGQR